MTRPRERRPKPQPMSPEEAADLEAKYVELQAFIDRLRARQEER